MFGLGKRWDGDADVVVVGTGAAGMTAALAAHEAGARVILVEKSEKVGGTTAVSGGVVWVPNNPKMADVGIDDSRDDALGYIEPLADGRSDRARIETFVDTAPAAIAFVEQATSLTFAAMQRYPDYHPERAGGRPGGRSLDPGHFDTNRLGDWKGRIRRSPVFGLTPMTVTEATDWGVFCKPLELPFKELAERYKKGIVGYGGALVGGLLEACLSRGIEPRLETAAKALIEKDGAVEGLLVEVGGQERRLRARKGVVLATGGFEWNARLVAQFLGAPCTHPNSPPINTGDGLLMAMRVGADLGNMSEAWWCPSIAIPGEEFEGRPLYRGDFAIRSLPHSVMVNRRGDRFVNEAANYNDLCKAFRAFDAVAYERANLPAWLVLDHQFVSRYALLTAMPGQPTPPWVEKADSLDALAQKIGVDPHGLEATVRRFNGFAVEGVDPEFGRGGSVYDHFYGDPDHQPNPNLGTIEQAPFYALQIHPGAIGTKGGPRTDIDARVLRVDGQPIAGLYAAGNVMAGVTGAGYPGAGATIAAAMTFGFRAGRHAAGRA